MFEEKKIEEMQFKSMGRGNQKVKDKSAHLEVKSSI